jgi:hypothetical protein
MLVDPMASCEHCGRSTALLLLSVRRIRFCEPTIHVIDICMVKCSFAVVPLAYRPSPIGVVGISVVWTTLASYSLLLAVQSPTPLFLSTSPSFGGAIIVLTCVIRAAMLSYTKVMANYHLKCGAPSAQLIRDNLEMSGTMMQIGATIGAGLFFLLVNFTTFFSASAGGH